MIQILSLLLLVLFVPVSAYSKTCVGRWEAPVTNADGSALTGQIMYRLYSSATTGGQNIGQSPFLTVQETQATFPCDTDRFFVVTAVDQSGNEGVPSNEIYVDVTAPSAPGSFTITIRITITQ